MSEVRLCWQCEKNKRPLCDVLCETCRSIENANSQTIRALQLIEDERIRQVSDENWTREHDDEHVNSEMAIAAACYAIPSSGCAERLWPWDFKWFKHSKKSEKERLIAAGALIVAELERLERKQAKGDTQC